MATQHALFRLTALAAAALALATGALVAPAQTAHATVTSFITRSGDELFDGGTQFRFLSMDAPNLARNEDQVTGNESDRWPSDYEIQDQLDSLAQIGGTVTRIYTLSYAQDASMDYHVNGLGSYSDAGFRTLDRVLQLASQRGIRVILPLIDSHDFPGWGGIGTFAGWSGNSAADFFTNTTVRNNFKSLVSYLLNRTNSYTGVQYKNDPTILAWQLGNELEQAPVSDATVDSWSSDMAAYIKSVDGNHLIMDGRDQHFSGVLNDPNIDIVGGHYYTMWDNTTDLAGMASNDRTLSAGHKPLIVDEFGLGPTQSITDLESRIISAGITGGMLWSIRGHNRYGAFRIHAEGSNYYAYHWPGFPSGAGYDETNVLSTLRANAYAIRGLSVPAVPTPAVPTMLPATTTTSLTWQGSAGASGYDLQRATSSSGPWTTIATGVTDDVVPQYSDTTSGTYFYRVAAKNTSGESAYSTPVGPVVSGWESLGGGISDAPAVVSQRNGELEVFVRGTDNVLWTSEWNGTSWSTWSSLGGPTGGTFTGSPAAVASTDGQIDVVVRGNDNALWQRSYRSGSWGSWVSLGGVAADSPALSSQGPGFLSLLVHGTDGYLWQRSYSNGSWGSTWTNLGGPTGSTFVGKPAATSWGYGRTDVVVRGTDNALWQIAYANGSWSGWTNLGGVLSDNPAIASTGPNSLQIVARGSTNNLYIKRWTGSAWTDWATLGAPTGNAARFAPAAVSRPGSGVVDVIAVGSDSALYHLGTR